MLDLHTKLEVKKVISVLSNYIYEPDTFLGIIYKPDEGGASCLIFASGKIIIAGAKSENHLKNIAQEIVKTVVVQALSKSPKVIS
jgi:transcription initiation factor TFIID TATA-box-binding protein